MFSVAPNIVFVPDMTQNAERKHRTQNTNTAHIRLQMGRVLVAQGATLFIIKPSIVPIYFEIFGTRDKKIIFPEIRFYPHEMRF